MKRTFLSVFAALAGLLTGNSAGLIVVDDTDMRRPETPEIYPPPRPRPPPQPPFRPWAPLEVAEVKADVRINDQIAKTSIDQEFYNPNPRRLEGTFLLPVPKGAHIDKFTMEIDGKQVEAELLAADKARSIYQDIVRKTEDPALLEYAGRDLFKVRIFPIEPHSRKRVKLGWTQVLRSDGGLVAYAFPLSTEKYSAKPVKNFSLKLDLETKRPLKSIYSPSHKVEVNRKGEHKATIGFESASLQPEGDFQLIYSMEEGEFGANLLTHRIRGEDGYFLLLVSPSSEIKADRVIAKDVTFVLDTSGSMAGAKLEQAKKALLFCLENLNEKDRFEVIRFSTEVESVFEKLVDATAENRSRAREFVKQLKPTGGTAIDDALRKALATRASSDRPQVIIFLTDGRPTVGTTDQDQIVRNVKKNNEENTRVFVFGIGTDVNTHLLDQIAEETKAFSQYVLPEEDLEVKLSSFFTKIKEPVLASPTIEFPSGVRVTKMYPSRLPDLFKGEQLLVAGRYSGDANGKIILAGKVGGDSRRFTYDVKFQEEGAEGDFIPRLWATRRVGYLLDEIRLHGENNELKDEVSELARKYNIVTPYTTYLIVEDEAKRGVAQNARTLRFEDAEKREQSRLYESLRRDASGDLGVAGAQSTFRLKAANAPADAISSANEAAARPLALAGGDSFANKSQTLAATPAPAVFAQPLPAQPQAVAAQSRYVGGRTFFLNEGRWSESAVQKKADTEPARIRFGSDEYFRLLTEHPEAAKWVALGRNVSFVLNNRIYEIFEEPATAK